MGGVLMAEVGLTELQALGKVRAHARQVDQKYPGPWGWRASPSAVEITPAHPEDWEWALNRWCEEKNAGATPDSLWVAGGWYHT